MYRNGTRPRESAFSGFSDRATANEYGNIYTSAVKPNPYDRETFLGLFSASITKTTHRGSRDSRASALEMERDHEGCF